MALPHCKYTSSAVVFAIRAPAINIAPHTLEQFDILEFTETYTLWISLLL
jgi:hypothetical protein